MPSLNVLWVRIGVMFGETTWTEFDYASVRDWFWECIAYLLNPVAPPRILEESDLNHHWSSMMTSDRGSWAQLFQELVNNSNGPFNGVYLPAPNSMLELLRDFNDSNNEAVRFAVFSIAFEMSLERTHRIPSFRVFTTLARDFIESAGRKRLEDHIGFSQADIELIHHYILVNGSLNGVKQVMSRVLRVPEAAIRRYLNATGHAWCSDLLWDTVDGSRDAEDEEEAQSDFSEN